MKVHSYAFVRECTDGAILEALEGQITFIGQRRSGEGEHGEWSFQTIAITDPKGDKLDVKLKDREEMKPHWKGKTVRIASTINSKNNRTGLYAVTEQHEGKTYYKAKATGSAMIVDLAEAASGQGLSEAVEERLSQGARPAEAAAAVAASAPAQQERAPRAPADEFWKNVRIRMAKIAGLQAACYDAAVYNAHGIYQRHGIAIMPGAVGIMADKIFIELARKTDIDLLPTEPYKLTPFRGEPLSALIPAMRQQIGEGRAEMEFANTEKRMELGRQSTAAAAPPVAPQPDPNDDTVPF